jgi:hypothetical protein
MVLNATFNNISVIIYTIFQGRIQDFKLRGAHLKKLRRAEGGANIFGVFRVKNHDFTPKNHIFPILGGAREIFGVLHVKNPSFRNILVNTLGSTSFNGF